MLGVIGQQCRALWQGALSTTILDPLAQLFQHCQGHERKKAVEFKFTKCCILPTMHCRAQHCCEFINRFSMIVWVTVVRLYTTANTGATTPNSVGATMLGVLRPFARSLGNKLNATKCFLATMSMFLSSEKKPGYFLFRKY